MPFDFNITTRQALLAALATDGASLRHDEDRVTVFREPREGREGVAVAGMYFWHDYPLAEDRLRLADGWQREIGRVNDKYAALWARLSALLRSDGHKTLVLSNSQHNLGQFAGDEESFRAGFSLGRRAFDDLAAALDAFGARNYRLLFLTRAITDLDETAAIDDPRLDHRFVGILSLRPDGRVARSIARPAASGAMASLAGSYENGGLVISPRSPHVAIVHRRTEAGLQPHGSITLSDTDHVAWLEGRDRFTDIVHGDGEIRFPDGSRWRRD